MNKLIVVLLILFSANLYAASLEPTDSKLIENAGIPIYSKAVFAYGNKDVGFRFAASVPAKEVQEWYRKQLPGWALNDQYGSWILYDGAQGKGMAEIMSSNQVSIKHNENLPQWHSLDKSMTTEIVFMMAQ